MPSNPLSDPNWAPQLADTIERVVGSVRDKTTARVVVVVRALVFGIVIALAAVAAMALLVIVGTKLLQVVVGRVFRTDHDSSVWVSYLLMAGLLTLGGMISMRKRRSVPTSS